jgi:endonuclease/exonuclease/phosphatase (EEP) superfamily protein YafD
MTQSAPAKKARWSTSVRVTLLVAGLLAWAAGGLGLVARYLPVSNHFLLAAAAFSPYLAFAGLLAVLLFLLQRRWLLATVAAGTAVAAIAVQLPPFLGETHGHQGVRVRVMTANLYLGQADPQTVVALAGADADVLAVQELTPHAVQQLSAAGLDRTFPFRVLDAREEASGTGVWSRFPLKDPRTLKGFWHSMITARLQVEGLTVDPVLLIAHLAGPWPMPLTDWNREYKELPAALRNLSKEAGSGCVIVAGDFNSTLDLRPFRDLLYDGYRDAAEQTGAGITATYPANKPTPPLLAVDHVLTRQCDATAVETVTLPGSDHRGLTSVVQIPQMQ